MIKFKAMIVVGAVLTALSLSGCVSNQTTESAMPVSGSYGQVQREAVTPTESLGQAFTTDYFSFPYDPGTMDITDLSDSSVTGAYLLVEPHSNGDAQAMTHLELFGGEKIIVPADYNAESWNEYAKELVSSYYAEPERVQLSVTATDFQAEGNVNMSSTIKVDPIDDIPAMTAEVHACNGENGSVIMVFTQYDLDKTDCEPYFELMDSVKVF